MLAWMLYATAVGAVLGVAGLVAEWGVRRLGRSVRWVWAAVLLATVVVPVLVATFGTPAGSGSAASAGRVADTAILAVWAVASLVLLTSLRLSAWTLRRNERSWRSARVGGRRVRVSGRFGPGVIGAVRPRVVLPEWLLADEDLRRLVVLHEAEHARAGDPGLLLAGLVLAALVPWCLPLWWQLRRLREAIETDCDARVLSGTVDAREYANALVAIAGRPTPRLMPVPALGPGRFELERRIRLITAADGRSRRATPALLAVAAALVLAIGALPSPAVLPAPVLPDLRVADPMNRADATPEAKVFLSVEPVSGD